MLKAIGTHSGSFQADEALGVFLLRQLKRWSSVPLVRSRDPAQLATLEIVIDVGGEYDHEKLRYDHHQRGFAETFGGSGGSAIKVRARTRARHTIASATHSHAARTRMPHTRPHARPRSSPRAAWSTSTTGGRFSRRSTRSCPPTRASSSGSTRRSTRTSSKGLTPSITASRCAVARLVASPFRRPRSARAVATWHTPLHAHTARNCRQSIRRCDGCRQCGVR